MEEHKIELTPEQQLELETTQADFELYQSQNTKVVTEEQDAKEQNEEYERLQSEFRRYVDNLPRKRKRQLFPQKKFGATLQNRFRAQRVTSQKHK